jgi:hypothetical protein
MFTYNVQLAGYPYEKWDDKGQTNYKEFIKTFDEFPWLEQLDKYNEIQEGCSATLTVLALDENKDFWVSIAGDRRKHFFLVGYVYKKEKKGWFGFGKGKTIKWVDIYESENKEEIKALFKIFFDKQFDLLKVKLQVLKKFDSMEAYTQ